MMENHNIRAKHNINLEVNAPCPRCDGHLIPFLKAIYKRISVYGSGRDAEFDHYEVYYRCSRYPDCLYTIEE